MSKKKLVLIFLLLFSFEKTFARPENVIERISTDPNTFSDVQPNLKTEPDTEELDLTTRDPVFLEGNDSNKNCSLKMPINGVIGLWKGVNGCSSKQWALSEYTLAQTVNTQLWCSDPGQIKKTLRHEALIQEQNHNAQLELRDNYSKQLNSELKKVTKTPSTLQVLDHYDPLKKQALFWDEREASLCVNGSLPQQMSPSLSAYALGQITTPKGKCDALLVEANFLTGRHAMSRISWVSSKCSDFKEPNPHEIATAIALGSSSAAEWQKQQINQWKWEGLSPRSSRVRSADQR